MSFDRISFRLTQEVIPEEHLNYFKMKGLKLACQEGDGKEQSFHYHMYFEGNLNTLRQYVKRNFPGGNAVYSIKKCDDLFVNYLRYICKGESRDGEPRMLFSDGYDIQKLHDEYWDAQDEFRADLKKTLGKRKRVKNVLEECWERIEGTCTESSTQTAIGAEIIQWYLDQGMRLPTTFAMSSMINTYVARLNRQAVHGVSAIDLFRRLYPTLSS